MPRHHLPPPTVRAIVKLLWNSLRSFDGADPPRYPHSGRIASARPTDAFSLAHRVPPASQFALTGPSAASNI